MLFLFVTSCEDNTIEIVNNLQKSPYKVKTVKLSEIPQIRDFINQNTNNLFYKTGDDKNGAIFDEENILEVIDTMSFTNYSFRFVYPDTPIGTFYNLVVGKTAEGENKEPFVLKYVCNENQLDAYIDNNFAFTSFKGKVGLYKYTDFFESGSFNKGADCPPVVDENGNLIPCDEDGIDGGSSNVGGGTGDTTGDINDIPDGGSTSGTGGGIPTYGGGDNSGGGGSSSNCTWNIENVPTYPCPYTDDLATCLTPILVIDCSGQKKSNDLKKDECLDCPKVVDGGVGVNSPNQIIVTPELEVSYSCQSKIIKKTFLNSAPLSMLILDIFDSDSSGYNLVFSIDESLEGTPFQGGTGYTSSDSQWDLDKLDIEIGLNPDLLNNGTDLAIATTVIHESVHAILLYALETNKITVENTNVSEDHVLYLLVQKFLRLRIAKNEFGGVEPNDVKIVDQYMHQYMTGLIDEIATSISEYGNAKGYSNSFNYYRKLASLGLEENIKYYMMLDGELDANEQIELSDINNTLLDEFKNRSNAKGTKCSN